MRFWISVWLSAICVCVLAASPARAATIVVPAGGDFQAALNQAQPGDVITLEPNATYIGNFVLPNKGTVNDYITIRSAAPATRRSGRRMSWPRCRRPPVRTITS